MPCFRKGGSVVIKELLPAMHRPAFRVSLLLSFLLGLYCAYLTETNLSYLQELKDLSVLEEAVYPPAVNASLLFAFLTGGTLFIMRGYLDLISDRRNGSWRQRLLLLGEKRLAAGRLWALIVELVLCTLPVLVISLFVQAKMNSRISAQAWQTLPVFFLISSGIRKLLAGWLVLAVSYLCGTIIALFLTQPAAGVLVCLCADQLLLARSPLYTCWLYDAFKEASFIVSVPESSFPAGFPLSMKILLGAALFLICFILLICLLKWGKKDYET